MRVRLKTILCEKTGAGERTEEPYLDMYWSGRRGQHYFWGPHHMRDGDGLQLDRFFNLEGDEYLDLTLYDSDTPGMGRDEERDDKIGFTVRINGDIQRGSFVAFFGNEFSAGNSSGSGRSYRLFYDVTDNESDELEKYCLKLSTLRCNQTQETNTDEVFITIDGRRVWGPQNMKEGDVVAIHERSTTVTTPVWIHLWEQDAVSSSRNDLMGTHVFRIGDDFDFSRVYQWDVIYDRGVYRRGSHYRLYYDLSPRRHTLGGCGDEHPVY